MDISVIKNDQMLSYPSTFLDIKQCRFGVCLVYPPRCSSVVRETLKVPTVSLH